MQRPFTYLIFAALLLVAQQSALSHQIGHIQDGGSGHSQPQNDGKKTPAPGLCVFHIAFSTVLGAIGSAAQTPQVAASAVERGIYSLTYAFPAILVIPASRGPPVLR
jgi:hypothetical protein